MKGAAVSDMDESTETTSDRMTNFIVVTLNNLA
jgi:hypothetical protein